MRDRILKSKPPVYTRPLLRPGYVEMSVCARGQTADVAAYLRSVAESLEQGCMSGNTGSANPCIGRWISVR